MECFEGHGPAQSKISAGIPSIPGDFPELVCLIAFETSSIVGGRSRLVITGFCRIWSSTVRSTVEGLLNGVLVWNGRAGVYIQYPGGREDRISLTTGLYSTNYRAKTKALKTAAAHTEVSTHASHCVVFLTDTLSVLQLFVHCLLNVPATC